VQKPGGTDSEHMDNVIRLDAPIDVSGQAEPQAPTRPGRGHGLAIAGMSLCALTGVFALLAFITVRWPGTSGETLKIVFIFSGVGFMTCASMAVFFAMKDTYARPPRDSGK
jgi:hypothetical protein